MISLRIRCTDILQTEEVAQGRTVSKYVGLDVWNVQSLDALYQNLVQQPLSVSVVSSVLVCY